MLFEFCFILFLIFFGGNYLIHLYFKKRRVKFFNSFENKKYYTCFNIKTEFSSLDGWQSFRSDIVVYENSLFLLLTNNPLNSKILFQNQYIIQLYKSKIIETFNCVDWFHKIESTYIYQSKIIIYTIDDSIYSTKREITLRFKNKHDDLVNIEEFLFSS